MNALLITLGMKQKDNAYCHMDALIQHFIIMKQAKIVKNALILFNSAILALMAHV